MKWPLPFCAFMFASVVCLVGAIVSHNTASIAAAAIEPDKQTIAAATIAEYIAYGTAIITFYVALCFFWHGIKTRDREYDKERNRYIN